MKNLEAYGFTKDFKRKANDYNLSRLERYLSVAWNSGAVTVVILTKADLCENILQKQAEIQSIALGADIVTTSNQDSKSINKLLSYLKDGSTAAFIGSSEIGGIKNVKKFLKGKKKRGF